MSDGDDTEEKRLMDALQTAVRDLLAHGGVESLITPLLSADAARYIVIGDALALQRFCGVIGYRSTSEAH